MLFISFSFFFFFYAPNSAILFSLLWFHVFWLIFSRALVGVFRSLGSCYKLYSSLKVSALYLWILCGLNWLQGIVTSDYWSDVSILVGSLANPESILPIHYQKQELRLLCLWDDGVCDFSFPVYLCIFYCWLMGFTILFLNRVTHVFFLFGII